MEVKLAESMIFHYGMMTLLDNPILQTVDKIIADAYIYSSFTSSQPHLESSKGKSQSSFSQILHYVSYRQSGYIFSGRKIAKIYSRSMTSTVSTIQSVQKAQRRKINHKVLALCKLSEEHFLQRIKKWL